MVAFGVALSNHNEFLGYHGDFDAGAAACFKTAGLFGAIALISLGSFALSAYRDKVGPSAPVRGSYTAV
jgi:hypothetical protein